MKRTEDTEVQITQIKRIIQYCLIKNKSTNNNFVAVDATTINITWMMANLRYNVKYQTTDFNTVYFDLTNDSLILIDKGVQKNITRYSFLLKDNQTFTSEFHKLLWNNLLELAREEAIQIIQKKEMEKVLNGGYERLENLR